MTSDVALVLIDPESHASSPFHQHARADWSAPLAEVVLTLLEAGVTVIGLDVILTREDRITPHWLVALRAGGQRGKLVLGMADGALPAVPTVQQISAIGDASSLAWVTLVPDQDGVIRRVAASHQGRATLGALLAVRAGGDPVRPVMLARHRLPDFVTWSAADVIAHRGSDSLADAFSGRIALIGAWLPNEDRHTGPAGRVPGVLLHALATDAWVHERGVRVVPPLSAWSLLGVTALLAVLIPRLVTVLTITWTASALIGIFSDWALPWAPALVLLLLTASTSWLAALQARARTAVAWVPRAFRDRPDDRGLDRITVAFLDIASFTEVSEGIDPMVLGAELDACLVRLGAEVERHGGFVDKYLGDGLMALFGAGHPGDGAVEALAAARACLAAADRGELRLSGNPVRLRVGLASGYARVGALGDRRRAQFSAVGDVVNVAARLEQLNKSLGTTLLADAPTAAATPGAGWRDLGQQALRGRREPVQVWAL